MKLLCANSEIGVAAGQDVLGGISEWFQDWCFEMHPASFSFLLRGCLLFGLPCAFCWWSLTRGNRSLFVQWLCCLAGLLLAALLPVHLIEIDNRMAKTCIVAFAAVLLGFLPGLLPKFLAPTVGAQRRLRVGSYVVIGLLFIINSFRR